MKRKLTALALCLVLALSVSVPALATEGTATPTGCEVTAYGKPVSFAAFTANETVYLRLRDVAKTLSGTAVQFDVTWTGRDISITTDAPYTSVIGSEMTAPFSGDQSYSVNPSPVLVNGRQTALDAIFLTDAKGNGYTYCSPEALSGLLGFVISFDGKTGSLTWESPTIEEAPAEMPEEIPTQEEKATEGLAETPEERAEEPAEAKNSNASALPQEQPAEDSGDVSAEQESAGGVDPILWTGE